MSSFDLFSIGHSNIPAERFFTLLRTAGVNAVADVRSVPVSRRFPWFSAKTLAASLEREGVIYAAFGATLGGRPATPRSMTAASPITRRWRNDRNFWPASIDC